MRTKTKAPLEDVEIILPTAKYLAAIEDTVLAYNLYADQGVEVTLVTVNADGDHVLTVAGGVSGTQYNVAIALITSGGTEKLFQCRVRVIDRGMDMQETIATSDPQVFNDDGVSDLIIGAL